LEAAEAIDMNAETKSVPHSSFTYLRVRTCSFLRNTVRGPWYRKERQSATELPTEQALCEATLGLASHHLAHRQTVLGGSVRLGLVDNGTVVLPYQMVE